LTIMGSRKRNRRTYECVDRRDNQFAMGDTLSRLRDPKPQEPMDRSNSPRSQTEREDQDDDGWEVVESKKAKKRQKTEHKGSYPSITHSPQARLQTKVRISDLQSLALYLIADGTAPQWVSVRHHHSVRKVVVLMVPGLEPDMFSGKLPLSIPDSEKGQKNHDARPKETPARSTEDSKTEDAEQRVHLSPDDYYPIALQQDKLPAPLQPLANMFSHVWPVKTPGDDKYHRIHSPLHAMLISPTPKSKEEKKQKGPGPPHESKFWENQRTPIDKFLLSLDELEENEYTIHPALGTTAATKEELLERRRADRHSVDNGWVDSKVDRLEDGDVPDGQIEKGSITAGRTVLAMDCEMCATEGGNLELTRISVIAWDGSIILDELVKPDRPITDYLTM
jgi:RNA exonuclease 1